ncbi:MAG: aminoacyl-tRNA hydrolase [Rikenellaceae bacterium]
MKYLIVGLGNIGSEYSNTRHNIGFKVLDELASKSDVSFSTERYGDVATMRFKGRTLILLKPSTYMNLSGKAVKYWMEREKISLENLMVVVDDLAIPFGKIRIRKSGSDAGHNGLKNINELLSTQNYIRIRMGIGSDFARGMQVDFVLGEWSDEEKETLKEHITKATEAIKAFSTIGIDRTMNQYNSK